MLNRQSPLFAKTSRWFAFVGLFASTAVIADEWLPVKKDEAIGHHIEVWEKKDINQPYRSYKLNTTIDAPIDRLVRIFLDVERYNHWFFQMKEAKLLKTISDTEFYSYLVYHQHAAKQNARDVIIHTKIEPMTASKPYDVFLLKAISDYLPLDPPHIRMLTDDATIKLTPIAGNQTRYEIEGAAFAGDMPVWALPYYKILGLERRVKDRSVTHDKRAHYPLK